MMGYCVQLQRKCTANASKRAFESTAHTDRTARWQFLFWLDVGFEMDAPDPVLCVVHSDAEPLVSLRTNWESLVGEAFGYYDSSAVAMVTAKVPIALDMVLIRTVLEWKIGCLFSHYC